MKSWLSQNTIFLTSNDWFVQGHDIIGGNVDSKGFWRPVIQSGVYVWNHPPAVADFFLEELRKASIKQKTYMHVVVIAKLI